MEAADSLISLLDQLHDIAEPPPVPMTPQTWAWAILAALAAVALVLALWLWARHRRATAWRRAALAELDALTPDLRTGDPTALASLQVLLRRVALATAPRPETAPLNGAAWTRVLGSGFAGIPLADAPYREITGYDGPAAVAAARAWIAARHA